MNINTVKNNLRKGFDSLVFDAERGLTGWKNNGDHVWMSKTFDMWVVEGDTFGRKPFKTFNGAFNLFLKHIEEGNIDIALGPDGEDFININEL